jgi:hypothetical protein
MALSNGDFMQKKKKVLSPDEIYFPKKEKKFNNDMSVTLGNKHPLSFPSFLGCK